MKQTVDTYKSCCPLLLGSAWAKLMTLLKIQSFLCDELGSKESKESSLVKNKTYEFWSQTPDQSRKDSTKIEKWVTKTANVRLQKCRGFLPHTGYWVRINIIKFDYPIRQGLQLFFTKFKH